MSSAACAVSVADVPKKLPKAVEKPIMYIVIIVIRDMPQWPQCAVSGFLLGVPTTIDYRRPWITLQLRAGVTAEYVSCCWPCFSCEHCEHWPKPCC